MPEPAIGRESYMHRAAKEVVARWLRDLAAQNGGMEWSEVYPISWRPNRGGPHYGVWIEYPLTFTADGHDVVWDECGNRWRDRPPTVEELRADGMTVAFVADLAIQHKGRIIAAIEIVHRHPVPPHKRAFYAERDIDLVTLHASWVLNQTRRLERLAVMA